jgi:hypothetical protein
MNIPVLDRPPVIDGIVGLEERANAAATSMTLLGSLDIPRNTVTVYTFVVRDSIYVGFDCADSDPGGIVTRITAENGPVFVDDAVEFYFAGNIEPTKSNYFHFAVNASGVKYSNDMEYDRPVGGWTASCKRNDKGWQAEILIPLRSVRTSTDLPYWRANFARVRPARKGEPEEKSAWSNPGTTMHNFRRFGYLKLNVAQPGDLQQLLEQLKRLESSGPDAPEMLLPESLPQAAPSKQDAGSTVAGFGGVEIPVEQDSKAPVPGFGEREPAPRGQ